LRGLLQGVGIDRLLNDSMLDSNRLLNNGNIINGDWGLDSIGYGIDDGLCLGHGSPCD
jgi:hypothetical protein